MWPNIFQIKIESFLAEQVHKAHLAGFNADQKKAAP